MRTDAPAGTEAITDRVIELAPVLVLLVDVHGTITWAGGNLGQLTGWTQDEVVGTSMLDHMDTEWNPMALDAALYAMTASGLQRPMLYRLRRKDGSTFIAEVTANAQTGGDLGAVVAYVRRCDEQYLLDRVIESLAAAEPLESTLRLLVEVMGAENLDGDGVVLRRDAGYAGVPFGAAVASPGLPDALARDVGLSGAPWADAATDGEPRWVRAEALPRPLAEAAEAAGYRWCWCWPVPVDGSVGACLVLWRRADEEPDHTCRMVLQNLVHITGLVIERDRAARQLQHAADHDALTGLANRGRCFAELADALAPVDGGPAAVVADPDAAADLDEPFVGVLYVDLDDFKPVNDRLGHAAGDEVLRTMARRLRHAVRDGDLVARLGGDEFAVVCPRLFEPDAIVPLAERVTSALQRPLSVHRQGDGEEVVVRVGASVGSAAARRGSATPDQLLAAADAAQYQAKATGRGGWRSAPPLERRRGA